MFKIKFWWNPREEDLKQTVEKVAIRCINSGNKTIIDVDILDTTYQDIINFFALNTMLHHVGMLWIIENHEELKYYMDMQNSDCLTGGPWYNTYICNKLHGKLFEGFIINEITDRYNIMCSIYAYERENKSTSCDDGRSGGGCSLRTNSTTEALELIGATIYFIGCCLKVLDHNLLERYNLYTHYGRTIS